ncbi:MAG: hypothetical protein K2Y37_27255 [Pirellulales bacterium]|nr:hypothetical protein [Pirellulales bacterium]
MRTAPAARPAGPAYDPPFVAPHSGQLSRTTGNRFEVVYGPYETRIYVYDAFRAPKSAQGIQGSATMQVQSTGQVFQYPVQFVAVTGGQDYLAIQVDLTRVRDGDMKIDFQLANVPSDFERSARFTQLFSMSRAPAAVTVVPLTENDRSLVEKQRVCPVMDAGLNEHGQPIKLMVGGQPVFVCCESCVEEVKKDPQKYVAKVAAAIQPTRPQAAVFWASDADAAGIQAQAICPVTKQPLGAHGRPLKVVVEGRPIFVCCQGCIAKVQQNPELYLSPVARQSFAELNTRQDTGLLDESAANARSTSGGSRCSGNGCGCNSRR